MRNQPAGTSQETPSQWAHGNRGPTSDLQPPQGRAASANAITPGPFAYPVPRIEVTMKPNTPIGYTSWEAKEAAERLWRERDGHYIDKHGIVREGIPRKERS
jgi:hypothetical protein